MNDTQFNEQMNRLIDTYGAKAYPKERVKGIWFAFRHYHIEDFKNGITKVINESYYPPMLSKIRESVTFTRDDNVVHDDCGNCDSTGRVLAFRDQEGELYPSAFRCHCDIGARYESYLPWKAGQGYVRAFEYYKKHGVKHEVSRDRSREKGSTGYHGLHEKNPGHGSDANAQDNIRSRHIAQLLDRK